MKKHLGIFGCLLLVFAMLLGTAGCKTDKNNPADTKSDSEETEDIDLLADLPQGYFATEEGSSREFKILNNTSNYGLTIMDTESVSTTLDSEIFNRNRYIEEKLGILFDVTELGFADNYTTMYNLTLAGTYNYDICYNEAWEQALLIQVDAYRKTSEYKDYIDLTKPWWYSDVIDNLSVFGNSYLIAGDMQMMYNDSLWCLAVNNDIVEDHTGVTHPYDLVKSGDWTFDALYQICVDTWVEDVNNPKYGVVTWHNFANAMMAAGEVKLIVKDEEKGLVQNTVDTHFVDVYGKLLTQFFTESGDGKLMGVRASDKSENWNNFSEYLKKFQGVFTDGNATFMAGTVGDMRTYLIGSEMDYGIVPMPKYSADQKQYISYVYEGAALCGIPTTIAEDDLQYVCTVLEWLCAYSYQDIRPLYYDNILHGRVAKDPTTVEMLDIVFGVDERGKAYMELDSMMKLGLAAVISTTVSNKDTAINSQVSSRADITNSTLEKTVEKYR